MSIWCPHAYCVQTYVPSDQTSNHNPLNDLREELEIRNRAVVAEIGNVKALFLQQRFDDGFFQVELNKPTSQRLVSDVRNHSNQN